MSTSTSFTAPDNAWRRAAASPRVRGGGAVILAILIACVLSLPWTDRAASNFYYDNQHKGQSRRPPQLWTSQKTTTSAPMPGGSVDATEVRLHWPLWMAFGTTKLGQSLLGRCLFGGIISLTVGLIAAVIAVTLGVTVGLIAGYAGGWVDHLLMRVVEVLDCLPYLLMVILLKIALQSALDRDWLKQHGLISAQAINLITLFSAIGLVSWLTMARVIRGQVLSLRAMPFVDAARAIGVRRRRILLRHLLPNLVGPITVYATLTVPSAILQESTLSFLGIGIQPPLPTWGSLASEGLPLALNPVDSNWWLLVFPCMFLAVTLLSLNFLGDGLRDAFDPKRRAKNV